MGGKSVDGMYGIEKKRLKSITCWATSDNVALIRRVFAYVLMVELDIYSTQGEWNLSWHYRDYLRKSRGFRCDSRNQSAYSRQAALN